jgi:hypothetical protein
VYVLRVSLAAEWDRIQSGLPSDWVHGELEANVGEVEFERAASFLAPAQPYRTGAGILRVAVARDGSAPSPTSIRRMLARLDASGMDAKLTLVSSETASAAPRAEQKTLAQSWDDALTTVPADWSDLVGEIDLISSDYLDLGALQLAPINPRRLPQSLTLRFRSARIFGYGASPGMVRRCLERCDAKGIRGGVRVVRVLSDTKPVGTQGPVWQMDGRTV